MSSQNNKSNSTKIQNRVNSMLSNNNITDCSKNNNNECKQVNTVPNSVPIVAQNERNTMQKPISTNDKCKQDGKKEANDQVVLKPEETETSTDNIDSSLGSNIITTNDTIRSSGGITTSINSIKSNKGKDRNEDKNEKNILGKIPYKKDKKNRANFNARPPTKQKNSTNNDKTDNLIQSNGQTNVKFDGYCLDSSEDEYYKCWFRPLHITNADLTGGKDSASDHSANESEDEKKTDSANDSNCEKSMGVADLYEKEWFKNRNRKWTEEERLIERCMGTAQMLLQTDDFWNKSTKSDVVISKINKDYLDFKNSKETQGVISAFEFNEFTCNKLIQEISNLDDVVLLHNIIQMKGTSNGEFVSLHAKQILEFDYCTGNGTIAASKATDLICRYSYVKNGLNMKNATYLNLRKMESDSGTILRYYITNEHVLRMERNHSYKKMVEWFFNPYVGMYNDYSLQNGDAKTSKFLKFVISHFDINMKIDDYSQLMAATNNDSHLQLISTTQNNMVINSQKKTTRFINNNKNEEGKENNNNYNDNDEGNKNNDNNDGECNDIHNINTDTQVSNRNINDNCQIKFNEKKTIFINMDTKCNGCVSKNQNDHTNENRFAKDTQTKYNQTVSVNKNKEDEQIAIKQTGLEVISSKRESRKVNLTNTHCMTKPKIEEKMINYYEPQKQLSKQVKKYQKKLNDYSDDSDDLSDYSLGADRKGQKDIFEFITQKNTDNNVEMNGECQNKDNEYDFRKKGKSCRLKDNNKENQMSNLIHPKLLDTNEEDSVDNSICLENQQNELTDESYQFKFDDNGLYVGMTIIACRLNDKRDHAINDEKVKEQSVSPPLPADLMNIAKCVNRKCSFQHSSQRAKFELRQGNDPNGNATNQKPISKRYNERNKEIFFGKKDNGNKEVNFNDDNQMEMMDHVGNVVNDKAKIGNNLNYQKGIIDKNQNREIDKRAIYNNDDEKNKVKVINKGDKYTLLDRENAKEVILTRFSKQDQLKYGLTKWYNTGHVMGKFNIETNDNKKFVTYHSFIDIDRPNWTCKDPFFTVSTHAKQRNSYGRKGKDHVRGLIGFDYGILAKYWLSSFGWTAQENDCNNRIIRLFKCKRYNNAGNKTKYVLLKLVTVRIKSINNNEIFNGFNIVTTLDCDFKELKKMANNKERYSFRKGFNTNKLVLNIQEEFEIEPILFDLADYEYLNEKDNMLNIVDDSEKSLD